MDTQKEFKELLKPVRQSQIIELLVKEFTILITVVGGTTFFLLFLASFIVFVYFFPLLLLLYVVAIGVFLVRLYRSWPNEKETVQVFNQFVEDDYAIAAYEYLEKDGAIEQQVVKRGIKEMMLHQTEVKKRKKRFLYPSILVMFLLSVFGSVLLYIVSPSTLEATIRNEKERKIVAKVEKELEKKEKEKISEETKKELKELVKELGDKKKVEASSAILEKKAKEAQLQKRKLLEKKEMLEKTLENLKKNNLQSLANVISDKDFQALESELKKLNEQYSQLSEQQKKAISELTGTNNSLSDKQLEEAVNQLASRMEELSLLKDLESLEQDIMDADQLLEKESIANGITPPSSSLTSNLAKGNNDPSKDSTSTNKSESANNSSNTKESGNSSSGNGSTNNSGSNSGAGSGNESGAGSGNESGAGSGNESGAGSGNESGAGSGNGSGNGSGLGSGSRELLTIPEKISGKENVEIDTGKLGQGKQGEIIEGEGPVLKGNVQSYDQVFSQYEESYRQSTTRYKLPQDLESIVKTYFTDIKPNEK